MNGQTLSRALLAAAAAFASVAIASVAMLMKPGERKQQSNSTTDAIPPAIDEFHMGERRPSARSQLASSPIDFGSLLSLAANPLVSSDRGEISEFASFEAKETSPGSASLGAELSYGHTAIGAVIRANGGRIPATGEELQHALQKLGDFAQLPIPFSAVALDSGLSHPRVVLTQIPPHVVEPKPAPAPAKGPPPKLSIDLLGTAAPDRPNLVGRLYIAANMEYDRIANTTHVKNVEFISWNSQLLRFDFGVIEGMGKVPTIEFVDGIRCASCHKNKGPILNDKPWSNSSQDGAVLNASMDFFKGKPEDRFDGMMLLKPQAAEVDAGVRIGADFLQNRKILRALVRSSGGREALSMLLCALVEPGSLEHLDEKLKPRIDAIELTRFAADAAVVAKALQPSTLIDFNPGASLGHGRSGWGCDSRLVAEYDSSRSAGNHGMTAEHQPSNPKAFKKALPLRPNRATDLVSAVMLARTIGLTEGDRRFLIDTLNAAARSAGRLQVDTLAIAKHIFNGPDFSDVFKSGDLPDRDDFKDRFLSGIESSMKVNAVSLESLPQREKYTSGPRRDKSLNGSDSEFELAPTTSCLRCHDVAVAGKKKRLSPIPDLAFDPFDKAGRQAWLASADGQKKEAVLNLYSKRIGTDRDMPPEDSLEYRMFRAANPASFDEVKRFLEGELKKLRNR